MHSEYQFRPLHKPNSIRLVRIEPQRLTDDPLICCTIQHFPDESQKVPSYDALSYVWGDTNVKETIFIRDSGDTEGAEPKFCKLDVHKNLWKFLDHMSKSKDSPPWLWTDFLCINQDSVQEKEEQISRMGEIYSNARQTIAWLGRSDPSTSQIHPKESVEHHMSQISTDIMRTPKLLKSLQDAIESQPRYWTNWMRMVRSGDQKIWERRGSGDSDVLKERRSQTPDGLKSRSNPWMPALVDNILSLDYWKRIWIVQEVALAKKVELRYGDTTLDFDDFIRAYQVRFFDQWTRNSQAITTQAIAAVEARIAGDDITVREIITWSQRCKCSVPVDRVKGLLGLLRKQKPDSEKENPVYAYLDGVFAIPLQRSSGIIDLADYDTVVDELGIALLGQPSPTLDLKNLESYSNDRRNSMGLSRMAGAAKRIAISCAAIGFGSARVLKDSFVWRPTTGSPECALFDFEDENPTMPLQILIASLFFGPVRFWPAMALADDGDSRDRTMKAALIGIRQANRVKGDSEWACLPAADHKCSCTSMWHEQLDISCELTLVEGADHPISGRPLCASHVNDHGHNCHGSTLFLGVKDVEHDGWRLSLTLKDGRSPRRIAALDISFQYCRSNDSSH